jgi:hypothetical protein
MTNKIFAHTILFLYQYDEGEFRFARKLNKTWTLVLSIRMAKDDVLCHAYCRSS